MILLATEVLDGRPDQRSFGAIDIAVRRNGYGRQVDSFEADLDVVDGLDAAVPRRVHPRPEGRVASAPASRCSPSTTACRSWLVRATCTVASFHPELTGDARLHARSSTSLTEV